MSVTYRILDDHGLVYVQYGRVANVPDARSAFTKYLSDPKAKTGHRHFVDLSYVQQIDCDVPEFFKLQLDKIEGYLLKEAQTVIVYYAPHAKAQEFATLCKRSWEMVPSVVTIIVEDEAEALSVLGVPYRNLSLLLEPTPEIG